MKLKALVIMTLAACLQASPVSAAATNDDFQVQFPKGENYAELNGTIQGYAVDRYSFYAKKGQIVSLEVLQKDPQIQFTLAYAKKTKQVDLAANYQVLPYSGKYILTVGQMRNDARKQPKERHFYHVKLVIDNPTQAQVNDNLKVVYRCDNGKTLAVEYVQQQAQVLWQGKKQTLSLDKKLSSSENTVFANQQYLLSLQTISPANWQHSKINSWLALGKKATDDRVLLQECVPTSAQ